MLGVTPEMAFFFYSFFKLSIFCRSDEKFDGVCQQLQIEHKLLLRGVDTKSASVFACRAQDGSKQIMQICSDTVPEDKGWVIAAGQEA